jgi:cell division protein FtsB
MKLNKKVVMLITGAVIFLFLFTNSGFRKLLRRYWEINKQTSELEQLKKENALLRTEIYYLEKDNTYIERIARQELGVIASDEVEYRFKK